MTGPTASVPTKRLVAIPGQSRDEEAFMSIAVALASELSVTRARLDTLERVLEDAGIAVRGAIEQFQPDATQRGERDAMRMRTLERVFRILKKMGAADLAAATSMEKQA